MEQFGRGDHDARAPEAGPTELRRMSRTFNEMARALGQQRRAQIAFLAGVAHDLRNPLSVLKMSAALVPPDRPLPPEAQMRRLIEKIARQISRLERMTSDFLDLANIEAGELHLEPALHDARDLAAQVSELFADSSVTSRLHLVLPEAPIELFCDSLRIEQVLTNLVSNAIKYSPAESEIRLSLEREQGEVVFRVVDHGIGIAQSDRTRIFEPFQRVGRSKENAPGAGLGLFVVRRIVEAHGGRIEIESAPDVGSTFSVRLPGRVDAVRGLQAADAQARAPGH
jgi:signal transduction histidine kinase